MTTYERRQRLLQLIHDQPGIRVVELAALLEVSEGTIRNDLNVLSQAGQLTRVRGGAVRTDEPVAPRVPFAAQAQMNRSAKEQIARWAANLVEDGDSILLDASTTAYHLGKFLQDRRNLTVVTSGLDVARMLAADLTNTVILLGGVLNPAGTSVSGLASDQFLADLHIKTAFMSCTGFTPEAGFTETDIRQAELKRKMVGRAGRVVVLVDSSKFGRADLAPFARFDQVRHIFTDDQLDPTWIERLRTTAVAVSLCGEARVTGFSAQNGRSTRFKIGFANLGEQLAYAADVRRSLERAAQVAGDIDLVLADNRLDSRVALAVADALIAERVDLAIEYQLDYQAGDIIMAKFQDAGIPVIAVDIPMVGATYYGVDNYRAGHMAGVALGQWIAAHWDGRYDRLIVLERRLAGPLAAARMRGQADGLASVLGPIPDAALISMDCSENRAETEAQVMGLLHSLPADWRLAVIPHSDTLALAAAETSRALCRQTQMAVVSQGLDREACAEMARPDSAIIGGTAYYPEKYGAQLVALALRILRGERVPPAVYINHVFIPRGDQNSPTDPLGPVSDRAQPQEAAWATAQ